MALVQVLKIQMLKSPRDSANHAHRPSPTNGQDWKCMCDE